jgi:hypothetical protein
VEALRLFNKAADLADILAAHFFQHDDDDDAVRPPAGFTAAAVSVCNETACSSMLLAG